MNRGDRRYVWLECDTTPSAAIAGDNENETVFSRVLDVPGGLFRAIGDVLWVQGLYEFANVNGDAYSLYSGLHVGAPYEALVDFTTQSTPTDFMCVTTKYTLIGRHDETIDLVLAIERSFITTAVTPSTGVWQYGPTPWRTSLDSSLDLRLETSFKWGVATPDDRTVIQTRHSARLIR